MQYVSQINETMQNIFTDYAGFNKCMLIISKVLA